MVHLAHFRLLDANQSCSPGQVCIAADHVHLFISSLLSTSITAPQSTGVMAMTVRLSAGHISAPRRTCLEVPSLLEVCRC